MSKDVAGVGGIAPLPLLVLALVLGIWIAWRVAAAAPTDFRNLALGEQTAPVYGSIDGRKVFCGTLTEMTECLATARDTPLARRALWLGNSQLFAVNQPKPGDETSPVLLSRALRPAGGQVIGFGMPSASLAEMVLMYKWAAKDYRPGLVIIPLFLDDTREQTVRSELAPALTRTDIAAMIDSGGIGTDLRNRLIKPQTAGGSDEADRSMQARSEEWITGALERCCHLQTVRGHARGQIESQSFLFRNWLFNVTAQTVRPIIPEAYRANLDALKVLLADVRKSGGRALVYVPPIRQDVKPPYDPGDYAVFKADTKAIAAAADAIWVDVDDVVPGRYWGTKAATRTGGAPELDFMHYQGEGHKRLAAALEAPAREALR